MTKKHRETTYTNKNKHIFFPPATRPPQRASRGDGGICGGPHAETRCRNRRRPSPAPVFLTETPLRPALSPTVTRDPQPVPDVPQQRRRVRTGGLREPPSATGAPLPFRGYSPGKAGGRSSVTPRPRTRGPPRPLLRCTRPEQPRRW